MGSGIFSSKTGTQNLAVFRSVKMKIFETSFSRRNRERLCHPVLPVCSGFCCRSRIFCFRIYVKTISNLIIFVETFSRAMTEKYFDNTETAFKLKSDSELERAYFLFKMISREPLVRIGTAVTRFALKLHLPVEGLIRSTVFDHFCGGVNEIDCMSTLERLDETGVYCILDYSV